MSDHDSTTKLRRYRYRTLREDYVEFCGGNTVAALLLDYFASIERLHGEARIQGERPTQWRNVGGRYGGLITVLKPTPKRETIYRALEVLTSAGLIEAHPDNGTPTKINQRAEPNRFRLITTRLHKLEDEWSAHPQAENDTLEDRGVLLGTGGPVLLGTHESVSLESVKEEEGTPLTPPRPEPTPDYLTSYQRELASKNDTAASMNGWQLVAAYAEAIGMRADTVWGVYRNKKAAAALASEGVTPEEVTAIVQEKLASAHPSYRFDFLISDIGFYRASKRKPAAEPAEAAFIDVTTEVDEDGVLLTYGIRADGSRELVGRG